MQAHAYVHKLYTCKQQAHVRVDKFACMLFSRSIGSSQGSGPRYLNSVNGVSEMSSTCASLARYAGTKS